MTDSILKELAEQIVREQIIGNLEFWGILVTLVFITTVATAFLVSYFTKRGQNLADRADLKALLNQLRATTDAAERVRVEIQHADWSAKEWKTIRRVKLEELFNLIYSAQHWLDELRGNKIFGHEIDGGQDPFPKLEIVCRLYFPELLSELMSYISTASEIKVKIATAALKIHEAENNFSAKMETISEFKKEWEPLFRKSIEEISILERKAPDVIKQITNS